MKSVIKKAASSIIVYNKRKRLIRGIRDKNRRLRDKSLFEKFPAKQVSPLIDNYPFRHKTDRLWLDFFFSVYREPVDSFIPLPIYDLVIEPTLNLYPLLRGVKEKNSYNRLYKGIKTPYTLLRRMNGFFYDENYLPVVLNKEFLERMLAETEELLIKPSLRSGSGQSIMLFGKTERGLFSGQTRFDETFLRKYGNDFVVQKRVRQHPFFSQFSRSSANTLRIFTYRSVKDDRIHILHTLLRIGKEGSFMDHDNLGGVAIGISSEGILNHEATDVRGFRHPEFNNILFKEIDKVPFLDQTREIASAIAREFIYGRLLAMDFIIDQEGNTLLLEINCQGNGVSQYQMNNGSLFGEFTKEILDFCKDTVPSKMIFT